jgi:DNA-binding CsgD family transcriptional regulator
MLGPIGSPTTPFVGRERELAVLKGRLEGVGRAEGGVVLIAGEPGIGKTRLMLELAERARPRGCLVLFGRAYESEGMPPYLPFAEALREQVRASSSAELRAQLGEGARDVALILPEVRGRVPDLAASSPAGPEQERYRLFESVSDFLLNVARASTRRGLLLALDDLQWADKPTLLLLLHLARKLATAPLLLVGTYRTVDLSRTHPLSDVMAELNRERLAERLLLQSFSVRETAALIEGLSSRPAGPALVEAIYHETEGNPFFMEEVVRHLRAEGHDLGDRQTVAAAWGVPEGVRQVIGKRLSRLSPEANRLLQAGAILGDGFTFDVLGAASGIESDPLMDALDEGLGAGVLREEGDRYHFTHALIRQTLYAELTTPRRVRLHRQAGEALEQVYAANLEPHLADLAHHFSQAAQGDDVEKAIVYARRAGDRALGLLAYEEGARFYQLALEALDLEAPPDELERCELLLALGDARRKAGELHQAMETFRQAAEVARGLAGRGAVPEAAVRAATLLGRAALGFEDALLLTGLPRRGADDPSVRLQEEALCALPAQDSALRARLLAGLARALRFAGVRERAASLSDDAVRMARRVADPTAVVYTLNAQRIAGWRVEKVDERLAVATELQRQAEEVGDSELALEGRLWRFRTLLEMGDVEAARQEIDAYSRVADELGQPQYRSLAATWTAVLALLEGRFADADRVSQQALALGHREQNRDAAMFFMALLLTVRRERGQLRELADLEPAASELAEEYPWVAALRATLALLYSHLGREQEARREFERLAANDFADLHEDWVWLPTLTLLAEVCASLGDVRRAARLYELMLPYAERNVAGATCPGVVAYHLGLLAATIGRWEDAAAHYETALPLNARMGARPALAHTQHAYAMMLLARRVRSDLPRARQLLESALASYDQLGMQDHAARVRALLAQPRLATVPLRAPAYPDGLTEREVDVLRLIAAGRSNREIADELVLSVRTVERHITNLYGKIDARGKADATAYALGHGLAEPRVP